MHAAIACPFYVIVFSFQLTSSSFKLRRDNPTWQASQIGFQVIAFALPGMTVVEVFT
jgi:hypothetical protein